MKTNEINAENYKIIEGEYHPIKDIEIDPAGYFLIRIIDDKIEAGFCKEPGVVDTVFKGCKAPEVYKEIVKAVELLPIHIAYLGRELTKAEIALKMKIEYIQDAPLDLRGFKQVDIPADKIDPNNYADYSALRTN